MLLTGAGQLTFQEVVYEVRSFKGNLYRYKLLRYTRVFTLVRGTRVGQKLGKDPGTGP